MSEREKSRKIARTMRILLGELLRGNEELLQRLSLMAEEIERQQTEEIKKPDIVIESIKQENTEGIQKPEIEIPFVVEVAQFLDIQFRLEECSTEESVREFLANFTLSEEQVEQIVAKWKQVKGV